MHAELPPDLDFPDPLEPTITSPTATSSSGSILSSLGVPQATAKSQKGEEVAIQDKTKSPSSQTSTQPTQTVDDDKEETLTPRSPRR